MYHTLCRLHCFRHLQARHFERVGSNILITFPTAKNDQLHQGRQSCLKATDSPYCPVRVTRRYFARFGLRFGAAENDTSFVNFQLRRQGAGGALATIPAKSLSASTATEDLRKLLTAAGVQVVGLTDKSVKMAGVTAAFESGATPEDVMHAGRWATPAIPLRYKHNSLKFKKAIAAKIPPLRPAQ